MAGTGRRRSLWSVFTLGVAMATLCFSATPALAAPSVAAVEPSVTITESCGGDVPYGVALGLSGFPPNTPFSASLSWNGGGVGSSFTTDANGSWSFGWGSYEPMGLVTFTVEALGQTFVATVQDPCEPLAPDTTPPVIHVPATLTVDATTPAGAAVNYSVSVSDNRLPTPPATCVPASGSTFPAGETIVICTATDAAGNVGTASFTVIVRSAADQLRRLRATVISSALPPGLTTAITAKLDAATRSADAHQLTAACGQTRAFVQELVAQSGKKVVPGTATLLVLEMLGIRPALGCDLLSVQLTMPVLQLEPACDLTHPDFGPGGHYGVAATLEGFAPGVTVTIDFYSSSWNTSLSYDVVTDALGGAGPIYGAIFVSLGTLTATAYVDGTQLAQTSIQDPCDP